MTTNLVKMQNSLGEINFGKILGDERKAEKFKRCILEMYKNTSLSECEPKSIINSALTVAELGLSPNPALSLVYFVPFKINNVKNVMLNISFKGYKHLAFASGKLAKFNVAKLFEGEVIRNRLTGDVELKPNYEPKEGDQYTYVAYCKLKDGSEFFYEMTEAQILEHALKYSQSYKKYAQNYEAWVKGGKRGEEPRKEIWQNNFDDMAKKTVGKALLRSGLIPLNNPMEEALTKDFVVFEEGKHTYPDNLPLEDKQNLVKFEDLDDKKDIQTEENKKQDVINTAPTPKKPSNKPGVTTVDVVEDVNNLENPLDY